MVDLLALPPGAQNLEAEERVEISTGILGYELEGLLGSIAGLLFGDSGSLTLFFLWMDLFCSGSSILSSPRWWFNPLCIFVYTPSIHSAIIRVWKKKFFSVDSLFSCSLS